MGRSRFCYGVVGNFRLCDSFCATFFLLSTVFPASQADSHRSDPCTAQMHRTILHIPEPRVKGMEALNRRLSRTQASDLRVGEAAFTGAAQAVEHLLHSPRKLVGEQFRRRRSAGRRSSR